MKNKTEEIYMLSAIFESNIFEYFNNKIIIDYFKDEDNRSIFTYIDAHIAKYKDIPKKLTICQELRLHDDHFPECLEVFKFYRDKIIEKHIHYELNSIGEDLGPLLTSASQDYAPREALIAISAKCRTLSLQDSKIEMINFNDSEDELKEEYIKKEKRIIEQGVQFGWETIDKNGGLGPGDVGVIVARISVGKTFAMLNAAHNAWKKQNKTCLFISMEMIPATIRRRMAAIHAGIPLTALNKANLTSSLKNKLFSAMAKVSDKGNALWIVGGDLTLSVDDISILVDQLQADVVYIDGASLLTLPDSERLNKFDIIGKNAQKIKREIASEYGLPVFASYHLNRKSSDKMRDVNLNQQLTLEDIGYSDEIGQLASVVLALKTPEDLNQPDREVFTLKNREFMRENFKVNYDFRTSDFSEIEEVSYDDILKDFQ